MELASRGEHTALVEKIGKLPAASVPDLILCLVLAATGEEKTSADRRMDRRMEISPLTNGGQDGKPGDDRDSRSDRARPRRERDRRCTAIRTLHGLQPLVPKRETSGLYDAVPLRHRVRTKQTSEILNRPFAPRGEAVDLPLLALDGGGETALVSRLLRSRPWVAC
jgi:hypothetical protein